MDFIKTHEPHPALQPSSVKMVRTFIARDHSGTLHKYGSVPSSASQIAKPADINSPVGRASSAVFDNPALAISLAMAFANICRHRGTAIPAPAIELLQSHVDEGDAACILVFAHLRRLDLISTEAPVVYGGADSGQT